MAFVTRLTLAAVFMIPEGIDRVDIATPTDLSNLAKT